MVEGFDGMLEKDVSKELTISPSNLPPPHLRALSSVLPCQASVQCMSVHTLVPPFTLTQHLVWMNPSVCPCGRLVACPLTGSCYAKCHTSKKGFTPCGENEVNTFLSLFLLACFLHLVPTVSLLPLSSSPSTEPPLTYPFLSSFPLPSTISTSHTLMLTLVCSHKRFAE